MPATYARISVSAHMFYNVQKTSHLQECICTFAQTFVTLDCVTRCLHFTTGCTTGCTTEVVNGL